MRDNALKKEWLEENAAITEVTTLTLVTAAPSSTKKDTVDLADFAEQYHLTCFA